jgi:hypothetical protein
MKTLLSLILLFSLSLQAYSSELVIDSNGLVSGMTGVDVSNTLYRVEFSVNFNGVEFDEAVPADFTDALESELNSFAVAPDEIKGCPTSPTTCVILFPQTVGAIAEGPSVSQFQNTSSWNGNTGIAQIQLPSFTNTNTYALWIHPSVDDMIEAAAIIVDFENPIESSYTVTPGWSSLWELRSLRFTYAGGQVVTMWHATSIQDPSLRYTIYWNPDTSAWVGWTLV